MDVQKRLEHAAKVNFMLVVDPGAHKVPGFQVGNLLCGQVAEIRRRGAAELLRARLEAAEREVLVEHVFAFAVELAACDEALDGDLNAPDESANLSWQMVRTYSGKLLLLALSSALEVPMGLRTHGS